jgi:EF-P beta-lysylation protein EpmB
MASSIALWREIQRENFTRIPPLLDFLELSEIHRKKILSSPRFPLNLPRRLAGKIGKNTMDDPILRQFVPLVEETVWAPGFTSEPLQDSSFRKSKKLLQKYNDRVLLIPTSSCAMNCRFCFRQNFPYEKEKIGFEEELAHLSRDSSISEVILSGGDPLSLSDAALSSLFQKLNAIPHLERIRFHSRFPIGIPERIDASFLSILSAARKQIFFVIHCNHPQELDPEVIASLKQIASLGIPLLNQSVLLKGVNDDPKILIELSRTLTNAGIIPYYLHELDTVEGTSHFALPKEVGPKLIRAVREGISGYGVPRLVREEPGHPSKTFIA